MAIEAMSLICFSVLSISIKEWPAYDVQSEEPPGYRHLGDSVLPATPWIEPEITEVQSTVNGYVHLYRWLNWKEYHWLLFFNFNTSSFWEGSFEKSKECLDSEIKREHAKWVATSLAEKLKIGKKDSPSQRVYTFPKNGIIIDLEFGGIPEVLGFTQLMMVETEPGELICPG